jgi:hypothetical protein
LYAQPLTASAALVERIRNRPPWSGSSGLEAAATTLHSAFCAQSSGKPRTRGRKNARTEFKRGTRTG